MTSTDAQVRLLMKERNEGRSQEQAAVKAGQKYGLCKRKG